MVRSFLNTVHWSSRRCRLTNDAAEADMAHAAVDHLRVARRRAIAPAVVRGTEKRATFDDLARNRELRSSGIETGLYRPAPRIVWPAGRVFGVRHMASAEPIGGPFPDISRHIEQPVAICREGAHRRGPLETVGTEVLPREFALPSVRHLAASRGELLAPDKFGAVQSAAGREFPLGLGRQGLTGPTGVSLCIFECDLDHRVIQPSGNGAALAFRVAPVRARRPSPPVRDIAQIHRTARLAENQ